MALSIIHVEFAVTIRRANHAKFAVIFQFLPTAFMGRLLLQDTEEEKEDF